MNQHYIHHNAVLPPDGPPGVSRTRNPNEGKAMPHDMKQDPYANLPMKPNQVILGTDQLHN